MRVMLKWFCFCLIDKLFCTLALLLSPVIALYVEQSGRLPALLGWFATPDSTMFGVGTLANGRGGDKGFAEKHKASLESFWERWWTALCWQWRNTGQGFSTFVLGLDETGLTFLPDYHYTDTDGVEHYRVVAWEITPDWAKGFIFRKRGFDWKGGFCWGSTGYRFRFRFGWKLGQMPGLPAQLVMSVSPIMRI